jgi:hypothetical protein
MDWSLERAVYVRRRRRRGRPMTQGQAIGGCEQRVQGKAG